MSLFVKLFQKFCLFCVCDVELFKLQKNLFDEWFQFEICKFYVLHNRTCTLDIIYIHSQAHSFLSSRFICFHTMNLCVPYSVRSEMTDSNPWQPTQQVTAPHEKMGSLQQLKLNTNLCGSQETLPHWADHVTNIQFRMLCAVGVWCVRKCDTVYTVAIHNF